MVIKKCCISIKNTSKSKRIHARSETEFVYILKDENQLQAQVMKITLATQIDIEV